MRPPYLSNATSGTKTKSKLHGAIFFGGYIGGSGIP